MWAAARSRRSNAKVWTQRLTGKRKKGTQKEEDERWKMLTEDPGNKLCSNRSKIKKEKTENNKTNYPEFLKACLQMDWHSVVPNLAEFY